MSGGQGRITQASVDAVLQRADIVDLVSGYTQLTRAGTEFRGRCPFHEERTPSFWVNPDKNVYHCFGCSASGDIVTFVQEQQGLDFVDTIELLADRYGVRLEYEESAGGERRPRLDRSRLYELLDATATFYEKVLWDGDGAADAREYLRQRNVSDETARAFRIGFSPEGSTATSARAKGKGYSEEDLRNVGLLNSKGLGLFRGRLMFPVIDRADRVIAFGGRKLRDEDFGGKYINSPDGPLFHKKQTLFTPPGIRRATADAGAIIVVEGYLDVIAMWQAGFRNTCAVMGTAMTPEQVTELRRLAPVAYFAFDPDTEGKEKTIKVLKEASAQELDVRVTLLPDGDPDEIVSGPDGRERMAELLEHSVTLLHYRVSAMLGAADLASDAGRDAAYRMGVRFFRSIPNTPERKRQIDRFAFALGLDTETVMMLQRDAGGNMPLPGLAARRSQRDDYRGGQQGRGQGGGYGPQREGGYGQRGGNRSYPGRDRGSSQGRGRDYGRGSGGSAGPGGRFAGPAPHQDSSMHHSGQDAPPAQRARSPRETAVVLAERRFLACAMRLAERKEVNLQASPITTEHFMLNVHKRAWEALCSTGDKPLDISRIRSDSDLVGLVAQLAALGERELLQMEGEHAREVMNELQGRLEERRLERAIAALKEALGSADEDAELMAELARLESQRRALNPRLRDTPHEE